MELLPEIIDGLRFDKSMRWDEQGRVTGRSAGWWTIGGQPLPFAYAGLTAGNRLADCVSTRRTAVRLLKSWTRALPSVILMTIENAPGRHLIDPVERRAEIVRQ